VIYIWKKETRVVILFAVFIVNWIFALLPGSQGKQKQLIYLLNNLIFFLKLILKRWGPGGLLEYI